MTMTDRIVVKLILLHMIIWSCTELLSTTLSADSAMAVAFLVLACGALLRLDKLQPALLEEPQ